MITTLSGQAKWASISTKVGHVTRDTEESVILPMDNTTAAGQCSSFNTKGLEKKER